MYLTTKVNTGLSQPSSMHQEVEFMFEFYHKQIEEISSMTSELSSHIRMFLVSQVKLKIVFFFLR